MDLQRRADSPAPHAGSIAVYEREDTSVSVGPGLGCWAPLTCSLHCRPGKELSVRCSSSTCDTQRGPLRTAQGHFIGSCRYSVNIFPVL